MASLHQSLINQKSKTNSLIKAPSLLSDWYSELLACLGSCLLVIVIAGVLSPFNNKPADKWNWSISLNAVLSVLVTVLYLLLLVPVSRCISQLKWNHYTRRQPFRDIDVFDQASRSPYGSLRFLLRDIYVAMLPRTHRTGSFDTTQRLLAWLAAFLTISVTAIGPFVQQIVSQEIAPVEAGMADVPIFNLTSSTSNATLTAEGYGQDRSGEASLGGLYEEEVQPFDVQSTCVNANCTWPPFWTLVVHSECTDVTDKLREVHLEFQDSTEPDFDEISIIGVNTDPYIPAKDGEVRYELPNGFFVSNVYNNRQWPTSHNLTASFPSVTYSERGLVLANFFFLTGRYINDSDVVLDSMPTSDVPTSATECIYQLAGRKVQAQYINGVYNEIQIGELLFNNTRTGRISSPWRMLMSHRRIMPGAVDISGEEHGEPRIYTGESNEPADSNIPELNVTLWNGTEWYKDPLSFDSGIYYLVDMTFGIGIEDQNRGARLQVLGLTLLNISQRLMLLLRRSVDSYGPAEALQRVLDKNRRGVTLQERIENGAKSLTRALRTNGWEGSQVTVQTTAYRDAILYKVSWEWITLPAVLVVLSFTLLTLTIWDTRSKGLPKWTDSVHAVIAFGGDRELQQALLDAGDLRCMKGFSKKQFVNLGSDRVLTAQRV